ncbi:gluconate 2-dehydrogenase subunit 3 family protein [Algoriphagus halophytocola]|uniref:Gluconate 2-dehydrogenase subunit 3 family protein n=1 Tax=Algoriphagus halophytocola TaxID=2991499 RepID=A0ABY6MH03_9BACT|nr:MULTISPECIES: gluconate 2-dehydrogenase subunit 3 family protein [unclassified Algoriphagus]UZD22759.1 gluconate 2-dehydrogenase subunit 3 family protein [Algoriphagus sp. TR-M5]WBL44024.1 gluconate 2-dehydrogenase subunit 3 family protein [Algoriphagus sp. TR-M9]
MNRRKSLKILGGTVVGIAGLALADWKWQLLDGMNHSGFFSSKEEKLIAAIADTIIPEGLPPKTPSPDSKPIGAISTGTDIYLMKLFEHCYEKEDQDQIKAQLATLDEKGFLNASKEEREAMLLALASSEHEKDQEFFTLMKSQTITGFTTVKEVMVDYRNYKVAPGYYHGCVTLPAQT